MIVAWWQRVGIAYLLLYTLLGPIGPARWLVVQAGRWLFDVTPTVVRSGSGDTTYHYVELVVKLMLAVVAATAWQVAARGRPVSSRTGDCVLIGIRYVLGATMLAYGWFKLIPVQMPAPGPDRLLGAIGDMSPMGLLWTFMGASLPYQMFAGFAEALGGVLLLWRRTALLGAVILVGVLTNVVVLNFCYDVPVKIYSTHLLAMALVLVAPHATRLVDLLILNRPTAPIDLRPFPLHRPWARWTAFAVKACLVSAFVVGPIVSSYQAASKYGFLAPRDALAGVYRVSTFARADGANGPETLTPAKRWIRVAVATSGGRLTLWPAEGGPRSAALTIDTGRRVWTMQTPEDGAVRLDYRVDAAGVVTLAGTVGSDVVRAVLTPDEESRLTGRGFHWINEFPFNR